MLQEDGRELDENKFLLASLTRACKIRNDSIKTKLLVFKRNAVRTVGGN